MKSMTVRLPDDLVTRLDEESRRRGVSRSDVVRERLEQYGDSPATVESFEAIADLIGTVDDLSPEASRRTKRLLETTGYGRKRPR